jgi:TPR repeat protein
VEIGNKGNDDELIQLEMVRAAEGSVPSMLTMADVNYFGARGMPRNQPEALRYYEMAAAAQNTHGKNNDNEHRPVDRSPFFPC